MNWIVSVALICTLLAPAASAADFFSEASALYEKGDFKDLERYCLSELKASPKSLEAYFFLVALNLIQDRADHAAPYIEKFMRLHEEMEADQAKGRDGQFFLIDARFTGLYFEIGKIEFAQSRYPSAKHWLWKAKSSFGHDPMLNFYLGICCKEEGEFEEAIKYFDRQLKYAPEEPSPYYNIACVYGVQGKVKETVSWLKRGIEAYPDFRSQASQDHDFDKIRDEKAFKELVGQ